MESDRQARVAPGHGPQAGAVAVNVIDNAVLPIFQTAQFHRTLPVFREKGVVQCLAFADHMRFGQVESDVIKLTEILAP